MPKLSEAQQRVLARVPDDWTIMHRGALPFRVRSLENPTIEALLHKGLIERQWRPPRWRRTDAGRAALAQPAAPPEERT